MNSIFPKLSPLVLLTTRGGFTHLRDVCCLVFFTALSGLSDSQGFVHAASMWISSGIIWKQAASSALCFGIRTVAYWLALLYLRRLHEVSPEVQTAVWFGVTIIGVALWSGRFLRWPVADQFVAAGVLVGIAWLLVHTGG